MLHLVASRYDFPIEFVGGEITNTDGSHIEAMWLPRGGEWVGVGWLQEDGCRVASSKRLIFFRRQVMITCVWVSFSSLEATSWSSSSCSLLGSDSLGGW